MEHKLAEMTRFYKEESANMMTELRNISNHRENLRKKIADYESERKMSDQLEGADLSGSRGEHPNKQGERGYNVPRDAGDLAKEISSLKKKIEELTEEGLKNSNTIRKKNQEIKMFDSQVTELTEIKLNLEAKLRSYMNKNEGSSYSDESL